MIFSLRDYAIWAINIGLNLLLVTLTWRKSGCKRWPFFRYFVQCSFLKSTFLVGVSMKGSNELYFYFFWGTQALMLPLYLGAMIEIFLDLFRPLRTLPEVPLKILAWGVLLFWTSAAIIAIRYPGYYAEHIMTVAKSGDRSAMLIMAIGAAGTVTFSRYFRMPWRRRTLGIAIGLFGWVAVRLLVLGFQSGAGIPLLLVLRTISMLSFAMAQITWVITILCSPARVIPMTRPQGEELQTGTSELHDAISSQLEAIQTTGSICEDRK